MTKVSDEQYRKNCQYADDLKTRLNKGSIILEDLKVVVGPIIGQFHKNHFLERVDVNQKFDVFTMLRKNATHSDVLRSHIGCSPLGSMKENVKKIKDLLVEKGMVFSSREDVIDHLILNDFFKKSKKSVSYFFLHFCENGHVVVSRSTLFGNRNIESRDYNLSTITLWESYEGDYFIFPTKKIESKA